MSIDVWQAFLPFPDAAVRELAEHLDAAERERAARLLNPATGDRFRCARGLLRLLLGQRLGVAPHSLVFGIEPGGRPFLPPAPGGRTATFSLSHSHDCIVIAVSEGGTLGIDVEKVRPGTAMDAIVRRFFKPVEREAWEQVDAGGREAAFLRLWTRKEAILKALGLGLTGLDRLTVSITDGDIRPVLELAGEPQAHDRWWCESWSPAPGYLATVASTGTPAQIVPRTWTADRTCV